MSTDEQFDVEPETVDVTLTLTVTVPAGTHAEDVVNAINQALDEPGNYGNDWGHWIVGGVTVAEFPRWTLGDAVPAFTEPGSYVCVNTLNVPDRDGNVFDGGYSDAPPDIPTEMGG